MAVIYKGDFRRKSGDVGIVLVAATDNWLGCVEVYAIAINVSPGVGRVGAGVLYTCDFKEQL